MKCTDARDAILIADPSELSGEASTELSRHLRDCAACAAAAATIVEHTEALRRALDASAPSRGPAVVLRRTSGRRRRWLVAAPALAAAGLAALLFSSDTAHRNIDVTPATRRVQAPRPLVDQPAGTDVAVFSTDNPNIVVVWFF